MSDAPAQAKTRFRDIDLSEFRQDLTPEDRRALMQARFPSSATLSWDKAFDNNIELCASILQDILKFEMAIPGQVGRNPGLIADEAKPVYDRLVGKDPSDHPYSVLPFTTTFQLLVGTRSLRAMQAKVSIAKSRIHRLLLGTSLPTAEEMERIAKAFHKQPAYFVEYRRQSITAAVFEHLAPETSIGVYERLWHAVR